MMLQSIPNHLNSSILSLVKNLFVYIEMTSKLKMRWFLSRKKTLFLFQPFSVFYRMYFYFQFISNKHHPRLIETVTMVKATVYFQYVSTSKLSSYCFLPHSLCAHGFCNFENFKEFSAQIWMVGLILFVFLFLRNIFDTLIGGFFFVILCRKLKIKTFIRSWKNEFWYKVIGIVPNR